MSGKISYILNIEGLDANIAKLKTLNDLLNQVNRKGGNASVGGNINVGGSQGTGHGNVIVPTGAGSKSAVAEIAGAAAVGSIASSFIKSSKDMALSYADLFKNQNPKDPDSKRRYAHLRDIFLKNLQDNNPYDQNKIPPIIKSSAGGYSTEEDFATHVKKQAAELRKKFSSSAREKGTGEPPFATSWFQRFKSGLFNKGGGLEELTKGKGLKELFSAAGAGGEISKLVGIFGRLGIIGAVVIGSLMAFKFALKLAIEGIKEASEAYRTAARRGFNVESSKRLDNVFSALGMGSPDLSKIAPQLGRGNDVNAILTAAQSGQLGEDGQQLVNMAEDFKRLMAETEDAARQTQESSRAGFEISMDIKEIGIEWKSLLSQIADLSYDTIHFFLQSIKNLIHYINDLAEILVFISQITGFSPKGDDSNFKKNVFSGGGHQSSTTGLEKMGFIFGASPGYGSVDKNTATIAANSNITVKLLTKIASHSPDIMNLIPAFLP